jgi:hypothetical protein
MATTHMTADAAICIASAPIRKTREAGDPLVHHILRPAGSTTRMTTRSSTDALNPIATSANTAAIIHRVAP